MNRKMAFLASLTAVVVMALAPMTRAADTAAAAQPSTDRVISHADLKKILAQPDGAVILDLRRNADYDKDTLTMPASRRFDPDKIADWSGALPKDKEILVFCAHGRSISDASVNYLTKNGYKARLVAGGFDTWKAAGGATVPKAQ
jgi:rhodanese-related sulfurtransferase